MIDKLPRYVYHALVNDSAKLDSILAEGLKPGWDGLVYTCTKPEHALNFILMRNWGAPEYLAIKIDVSKIKNLPWEEGTDHSPTFFPEHEVVCFEGVIPPRAFKDILKYVNKQGA